MSLVIAPCRQLCDWRRTRATAGPERLYACTGCGSQWVRSEPWSPRQADGSWPDGVLDELRHCDGPGAATSPAPG